jgi:hypothetical protein
MCFECEERFITFGKCRNELPKSSTNFNSRFKIRDVVILLSCHHLTSGLITHHFYLHSGNAK